MFKQGIRFFSTLGPVLRQVGGARPACAPQGSRRGRHIQKPMQVLRPHVKLASLQFYQEEQDRRKKRIMRRKERRLKKEIIRDVNKLKQHDAKHIPCKVDPVLGDSKCEFIRRIFQEVDNPESHLAYGIDRVEFEKLLYGAEKANVESQTGGHLSPEMIRANEEKKKKALLTILNLRNTSAKDKKDYAIKLARQEFQRRPGDCGSPEVQAAILTVKIHFGMRHVQANKKDFDTIQSVREAVQYRQRLLKYLKRVDAKNYFYTLHKLGLTDDVIMREFNMGREYLQEYKVWGDKVLIKKSDKQLKKQEKFNALRKKVQAYQELAKENFAKYQAKYPQKKAQKPTNP